MSHSATVSSYLVHPRLTSHSRRRSLAVWQIRLRLIMQAHPKLTSNVILAVASWLGLSFSYNYLMATRSLVGQSAYASTAGSSNTSVAAAASSAFSPTNLAAETRATALPGGPTGQLLPPGTMAPTGTYRNSYTWGNCTWYVAGRRPVPGNWHNATNWYYNAIASGYKVGTVPAIAAIAWQGSNSHGAGSLGHVALVEAVSADHQSVLISEMNYRGLGVRDTRWVPASYFQYIY